ncbi:MAG: transglutaminase [Geobacteraceae bacterium GWC2_58_44]|nr:MAG: transglutaminase [Geobacteraceae bacterium GWC2_58_44]HBG04947.1 transglutaminase [Geobacter sp.]
MPFPRAFLRLLIALLLLIAPLQVFAAIPKLASPPEGERWFSINLDGERVGFAHLSITKAGDGYRIDSEGSVKLRVMGFSREATSKESYLVGQNLALLSFAAESRIDGSPLVVKGEVTPKGIRVALESGGAVNVRTIKLKGPVYPPQALNILPLMQGAAAGKSYKLTTLDVESVKVKQVKVDVVGEETLAMGTAAVHLRNNLYPMVDNDVWVDLKGNSIKESVREDLVVTLAEDATSAKSYLADAALSKRDMVLDFSLVRVEPPIDRPDQLKKLALELTGVPVALPILQGKGQQVTRLPDGRVIFTMPNPGFAAAPGEAPAAADLEPAQRIPSDAPEIVARKNEIIGAEKHPARAARLLVEWVAKEVKGSVTDSQSPLETLKSRAGNCQSHARLYASLARAAGIATRFVSGLVYSPGQGFLYHSWAESYLDGWIPVDPTFGEMPANVTHIKLVEGDTPDEMGLLAGVIGRVKGKVTEKGY